MNDLDMDFLLGSEDDEGRGRRSSRNRRGGRRRRRRRNRGGFLAPMLALIVLVGVIGGGGYYGYLWLRDVTVPDDYTGQGNGEVIVEIRPGASAAEVAQILEQQGVVKSARAFTNAIDAAGKSSALQPGDYKLRKGMAAVNAIALLDPKHRLQAKVTIREGLRASQVFAELAKSTGFPAKDYQAAAKAMDLPEGAKGKIEGYLFPATYEITPKMKPADILDLMKERHDDALKEAGIQARAKALGYTQHEILTIASIVQAESGNFQDMPKVARVIYNRLEYEPSLLLQMDSTVMYGLNKFGIAATDAETKSNSPYNTYKFHGLPPGPIANPGDHAIEAALNPAKGEWRYFVTVDPKRGITKFTDSEAEFWQLREQFNQNHRGG